MNATLKRMDTVAFTPAVSATDALANHWLHQATVRLRREICWLWRERAAQGGTDLSAALPPMVDRTVAALDLVRYDQDKRAFFAEDVTAAYLSERLAAPVPTSFIAPRGSFAWLASALQLEPVECFVLALALLPTVDSAAGPVIACCLNDPARALPTLALAQRLWDAPDEVIQCFDPGHVLIRHGILPAVSEWHAPLYVSPLVARELLFSPVEPPASLRIVDGNSAIEPDGATLRRVAAAIRDDNRGLRVIPVVGQRGAALAEMAAHTVAALGMQLVQPSATLPREHLPAAFTAAWLRRHALYIHAPETIEAGTHDTALQLPLPDLPLTVFVGVHDRSVRIGAPTLPAIVAPEPTHAQRTAYWREALPSWNEPSLPAELARRFRYQRSTIARVGAELANLGRRPSVEEILAAARADLDLGSLAQPVKPRFTRQELMLPPTQSTQIDEVTTAMSNLTRAHYEWGTAGAWNEGGLAVLFAGPPGTGKTMAAEAIAAELSLPLYRIDLSQVVNKYIGETEKNLRRLFDAADSADVILFFDEADALFGKRTEVKDAHDRYANLEISYLLERMERFKGLAILATNRKKDLDEAFLRRLRFVVEFPLPHCARTQAYLAHGHSRGRRCLRAGL